VSGFGPPPGAPVEETRRRPPAYLPPGGLTTGAVDPIVGMRDPSPSPGAIATGGLVAPGSIDGAHPGAPGSRAGGVLRGAERVLLVSSHKPGIISLRPMTLGDVVDGAVKHIRRNAGVVFSATLVVLALSAVPAILVAALGARGSWLSDLGADAVIDRNSFFGLLLLFGVGFASLVLAGALSYSVGEASLGRRPGLAELWAQVRGRLLPLVALAALLTFALALPALLLVLLVALATQANSLLAAVLISFVGGLAVAAWTAILVTRTCLAGAAVVLERRRVVDALSRSWALTAGAFWRIFLRLLVVGLLCLAVFWVVQLPLLVVSSIVGDILSLSPSLDAMVASLGLALATLLSMTVVVPFAAGAISLVYVDQRMRLEGFDLVLQRAARATGNGS
jgi:hypothetical protein